jgi:hypothetical protein
MLTGFPQKIVKFNEISKKNYSPIFTSGDSPFNPAPAMAQQNPDP